MSFEHVNRNARLVLVGSTPGPIQIGEAYAAAQCPLQAGATNAEALPGEARGSFRGAAHAP